MSMRTHSRIARVIATTVLLITANGVVNAEDVARWSWQEPRTKGSPTGDLEWAPKDLEFKADESVRYTAIDFPRVTCGTAVDAEMTIDQLYARGFNGSFLDDFTGRKRPADGGEAGAIDDPAPGNVRTAYVVDQAAPGAADTNPGTEEKPFKTVQRAADAAKPGDTIYVMAGKYDERVRVKAGGTEGKPVAFVAMPRRSATVGGFDLEASYIRVRGLRDHGRQAGHGRPTAAPATAKSSTTTSTT